MSTINIQPTVTANGETILSVFTDMGLYTCLLGPDFLMKLNEANPQGSKIFGLGYIESYGTNSNMYIEDLDNTKNLYIYFYNSQGSDAVKFGKVPSFMSADLTCTTADITAKVSNKTKTEELVSTKEGLVKERVGVFNLLGTMCGVTCYWPQGYGTGNFDSMCVSLVDLETLKDNTSIADVDERGAVFGGTVFAVDNSSESITANVISYIRNNVTGLTDANTLLLKFEGRAGLWDYNMQTGEVTQSAVQYDGYMGIWGQAQYVIDGVLYGLTCKTTAAAKAPSTTAYLFKYDTSSKESSVGSTSITLYESTSLIKVGSDLYINTNSFSITSTSSTSRPTYKKITLSTLAISSTTLTTTVPEYLKNGWKINSFDDGSYILHDNKNMVSYKFTDVSSIESSITEPFFVCCGQPLTFGGSTIFMAAHTKGFYFRTPSVIESGIFKNVSYYGYKYMLLDGGLSPLLAYGKFSKTYEKTADSDFTSNYYITLTAQNT